MKLTKILSILVIGCTLALAGCGLRPSASVIPTLHPAAIQPVPGAEGKRVVITSKAFTEQLIMGKIAVYIAEPPSCPWPGIPPRPQCRPLFCP